MTLVRIVGDTDCQTCAECHCTTTGWLYEIACVRGAAICRKCAEDIARKLADAENNPPEETT